MLIKNYCPNDGLKFEGNYCKECGESKNPKERLVLTTDGYRPLEAHWVLQNFGAGGPIYGPPL
jgi:hypothetical protein